MSVDSTKANKPTLLVFGAGGHGRVVADAALAAPAGTWQRLVASDRNAALLAGDLLPGVSLLAADDALALSQAGGRKAMRVHVAIGHNPHRRAEAGLWQHLELASVIHPAAWVSPLASLALGCFVAAQAVVAVGAKLGTCVIVNHAAVVDHDCQVGAFVHLAPNATLGGAVRVGEGALVGAGATVLPGVSVGAQVVLGAGAVLTRDATEGTWVGVPARRIR